VRVRHAIVVGGIALAGLTGCGAGGGAGQARVRVPAPGQPGAPLLQAANGPVEPAAPGARPLQLRIAARSDQIALRFHHQPRAGLVFDLDTGAVLWRRLPARVLPIASLTKMMTALLVADRLPSHATARITRAAVDAPGSRVGVLPKGRRVLVETLLHGLLLPSGNDAAVALALRAAGSQRAFVALMNERARAMGLGCTRFASPSGFVDAGNHSCAADLAQLARAVLDHPRLARIVRRRQSVRSLPIKGGRVWLSNNNPLLRTGYPGTIGVKTGFTDASGHCLVAAVRRGGRRLGIVLLHSPDTLRQARKLLSRTRGSTQEGRRP
jgi:serine-type D-Ala-D-Ala carboxypeptidase (penicillin-binding protein 5/6)